MTNSPLALSGKPKIRRIQRDNLALHFDRDVVAPAEIGVEAGGQHLRQHAHRRAAAVHPSHEAGMDVAGGVGQDIAHELAVDRRQFGRRLGNAGAEAGAHLAGNRLPDRTVADIAA